MNGLRQQIHQIAKEAIENAEASNSAVMPGYVAVVGFCDGSHPRQEAQCDLAEWEGGTCTNKPKCMLKLGLVYTKATY